MLTRIPRCHVGPAHRAVAVTPAWIFGRHQVLRAGHRKSPEFHCRWNPAPRHVTSQPRRVSSLPYFLDGSWAEGPYPKPGHPTASRTSPVPAGCRHRSPVGVLLWLKLAFWYQKRLAYRSVTNRTPPTAQSAHEPDGAALPSAVINALSKETSVWPNVVTQPNDQPNFRINLWKNYSSTCAPISFVWVCVSIPLSPL
jgi:hypothetical protein